MEWATIASPVIGGTIVGCLLILVNRYNQKSDAMGHMARCNDHEGLVRRVQELEEKVTRQETALEERTRTVLNELKRGEDQFKQLGLGIKGVEDVVNKEISELKAQVRELLAIIQDKKGDGSSVFQLR